MFIVCKAELTKQFTMWSPQIILGLLLVSCVRCVVNVIGEDTFPNAQGSIATQQENLAEHVKIATTEIARAEKRFKDAQAAHKAPPVVDMLTQNGNGVKHLRAWVDRTPPPAITTLYKSGQYGKPVILSKLLRQQATEAKLAEKTLARKTDDLKSSALHPDMGDIDSLNSDRRSAHASQKRKQRKDPNSATAPNRKGPPSQPDLAAKASANFAASTHTPQASAIRTSRAALASGTYTLARISDIPVPRASKYSLQEKADLRLLEDIDGDTLGRMKESQQLREIPAAWNPALAASRDQSKDLKAGKSAAEQVAPTPSFVTGAELHSTVAKESREARTRMRTEKAAKDKAAGAASAAAVKVQMGRLRNR